MTSPKKWQIEFGGKSKQQLLALLSENKIGLNAYAAQLFMSEEFVISSSRTTAEVIETSVGELGLKAGGVYQDIINAAQEQGLKMCTLELAPQFRIQYLNQEEGPYLTLASIKTTDDESHPNGFYLRNSSGFYWLRGYRSSADWHWEPKQKFAFLEG